MFRQSLFLLNRFNRYNGIKLFATYSSSIRNYFESSSTIEPVTSQQQQQQQQKQQQQKQQQPQINGQQISGQQKLLIEKKEKRLTRFKKSLQDGEVDVLSEALINSVTMDQIIELIDINHNLMNNRHLTETFETIHSIIRANYEESFKLLSSEEFKLLCNRTLRRIRFFSPPEILTILKTLMLLEILPHTTIMQSVLQMTRQQINDFNIDQLIFLDFLLHRRLLNAPDEPDQELDNPSQQQQSSKSIIPLIDALRISVPLVFQIKIENKEIDYDNIDLVVRCLRMSASKNFKVDIINKLIFAIGLKEDQLTPNQSLSIIKSLSSLKSRPNLNTNLISKLMILSCNIISKAGIQVPDISQQYFKKPI